MNINITDLDGQAHTIDLDNLGNVALHIDCMELMKALPDKCFELAIVDPPYGIGNFIPQNVSRTGNKASDKVMWNEHTPSEEYFIQLLRVSKEQIIWGANYYNCFSNQGGALVWNKGDANPIFSQCEIASLSFQKRVDYVNVNWQSGFYRSRFEEIIHPCQKPATLYDWILAKYAHKGEYVHDTPRLKILDTHLGSQSSRIAAWQAGYDFLGCEIDKDYYEQGCKRYESYACQYKLF